MKNFTIGILLFLIFSSCNSSKEFESRGNYKFVIYADYEWEDNGESFYYELRTLSDSIVISKYWFLGISAYKEVKLTDFSVGAQDSLIYLKFHKAVWPDDSIVVVYDTVNRKELDESELPLPRSVSSQTETLVHPALFQASSLEIR